MPLPMRRFTLLTLVVLFVLLVVAALFQLRAGRTSSGRFCGPGQTTGCVGSPTP